MMKLRAGIVLLAFAGCRAATNVTNRTYTINRYVTASEVADAIKADDKIESCDISEEIDKPEGADEDLLRAAGGKNLVLEVLKDANSTDEIGQNSEETLGGANLGTKVAPLPIGIIIIVIWFFCCWTACPFCKCCRCCAKERSTPIVIKIVALVLMLALGCGIYVAWGIGANGYEYSRKGMKNMICATAMFTDDSLSGSEDGKFMGFLPMLTTMADLEGQLDNGSALMVDIDRTLTNTQSLTWAVTMATDTLGLLESVLQQPENVEPQVSTGQATYHRCEFCGEMASQITPLRTELQTSLADALVAARSEVDNQLSPTKRSELKNDMKEGADPLNEIQNLVTETMGWFLDDSEEGFGHIENAILGDLIGMFVILVVILASLLCICGTCATAAFTCREKAGDSYSRIPHRMAGVTWCWGMWFSAITMILGGIILIVCVPISGVCLTLKDLNGEMLTDIGPALGINVTASDQFEMMTDLVDNCFAADRSGNATLMEIMFMRENGTKKSMKQKINDDVSQPIRDQFDIISTRMSESVVPLAQDPALTQLTDLLQNTPMDALLLPIQDTIINDPLYSPMLASQDLSTFVATSTACDDHTLDASIDALTPTVPGLVKFHTKMIPFGPNAGSSGCVTKVDCSGMTRPESQAQCKAANDFMELKTLLRAADERNFKCGYFQRADGSQCDIANMLDNPDANNNWNDCLNIAADGSGTTTTIMVPCNLAEYVTYMQAYSTRIQKVFRRVDSVTLQSTNDINVDMRQAVDTHVLGPVDGMVARSECVFLGTAYELMIDSMCYQGVWGLRAIGISYVVCGLLVLVVVLLAYCIWRRAIDNVNSEQSSG